MAPEYNALRDHDEDEEDDIAPPSNSVHQFHLASPVFTPLSTSLFLDDPHTGNTSRDEAPEYPHTTALGLNYLVQSTTSRSTRTDASYDMVESEDFAADARSSPALSPSRSPPSEPPLHIPRARRLSPATAAANSQSTTIPPRVPPHTVLRSASGRSALQHPTPDLQVLKGAYTGNILHLEKTAEQLSMTSSMDDAIRELHDEQKRSDSRRSSLLSSQGMSAISRQVSNASSIVEVNSVARSGGFSPGFMMSPRGSLTAGGTHGRGRSASKSSKYGSRPEPELEGRPLDSFVNRPSMSSTQPTSPIISRSIDEQDENSATMTKSVTDLLESPNMNENETPRVSTVPMTSEDDRPTTSASISTFDQAQKMFADFDGIHSTPLPDYEHKDTVDMTKEMPDSPPRSNANQRRASGGRILSGPRPQSYMDPVNGQEMVYYPAPVPMMLNLPQKLSKGTSSAARNKRRSQVLSALPGDARKSAIWLPDVLENEEHGEMAEDEETQQQEYIPQHQRASMGGRRLTQDLSHMPAQLRASVYFDLPTINQTVELKGQSAVATLDSILDASAHAPVSAFTDHAFAGALGSEVYGKEKMRHSQSSSTLLLQAPEQQKKRASSLNLLLRGKRASSSDLLETESKRNTMSGVVEAAVRSPIEDDENGEEGEDFAVKAVGDEESDDGQRDDEVYHGPPTTLLAELQLRKQQQKQRTQHITKQFPTGIHSTLLEMDAVAQVQKKNRQKGRTVLAWEDPDAIHQGGEDGDDEDVPLAMLYARKSAQFQDANRPLGLMERRDMEDNEPLSKRRERLTGRPSVPRASTMQHIPVLPDGGEEEETLAQRVRRLKGESEAALPAARPVSGDFTSELMSQFGGDLLDTKGKGKEKEISPSPGPEEEETLAQRRKRLQSEREARAKEVGTQAPTPQDDQQERPGLVKRRSMADILSAHPATGTAERVVGYQKPAAGLLGLHEQKSARRVSSMMGFEGQAAKEFVRNNRQSSGAFPKVGGGVANPAAVQSQFGFAQPSLAQPRPPYGYQQNPYGSQMNLGMQNPYASQMNLAGPGYQMPMMNPMANQMYGMGGMGTQMNDLMQNMSMLQLQMAQQGGGVQPLNQGQIDMVERWRQSVLQ